MLEESTKSEQLNAGWTKVWPWAAAVAGLALLGGLWWYLAGLGAPKIGNEPEEPSRVALNAEQRKLSDDIGELEKKYERNLTTGQTGEVAVALLEQAMSYQRELLRLNPRAGLEQSVRLDRLEAARDTERAKLAVARIAVLEVQAEAEGKSGRAAVATEKLGEALKLQREVNNSNAASRFKNIVREARLAQALETAEAEPLHREFQAAWEEARAAAAAQRWTVALAAYGRARDAQAQLNQRYGRTKYADQPGLEAIEAEIASLNAAGAAAEIETRVAEADAAADLGRAQAAAELYLQAGNQQRELNGKFARSRFVSTQRVEELEVKHQTVLAAEMLAAVTALDRAAAVCLLKRQVVAAGQKIADAGALLERVEADFPKSKNLDGALKIKLAFLKLRRAETRLLQDQIYDRLVPVPEASNVLMLRTEVPQEIYAKVMSNNPSRNPGAQLPVDSVSWLEAQEFCQRLSWLLGTTVRLPTEQEFRAAGVGGDGELWSRETAGGRSQETGRQKANTAGFSDLVGNVAEWLQPLSAGTAVAPVAGGSYLDPLAAVNSLANVPTDKTERARHIGFRVVVELVID